MPDVLETAHILRPLFPLLLPSSFHRQSKLLQTSSSCELWQIVGIGAPVEFVSTLEGVANAHHANMDVDVIRAYHFGARFIVEVRRAAALFPQ